MNKDMQAYHKYITTNIGISRETLEVEFRSWKGGEVEKGEGSFKGRRLNNRGLKEVIIKIKKLLNK